MARIILIEDDEILAELVTEHLQAAGHMVSTVHRGGDALHAIDKGGPDLLVLDYNLPDVSGLEVLRQVRGHCSGRQLPVLMLTAKTGRLLPARAHQDGIDDYLVKPVALDLLLERIEALLARAALARRVARAAS